MKFTAYSTFLVLIFLAGCHRQSDNHSLEGTWRSNQEATILNALADPKWNEEAREKIEAIRPVFGLLTITYEKEQATSDYDGSIDKYPYRIVESGDNWVEVESVIRGESARRRLEFTDDRQSYWVDTELGFPERFDRVSN